ncbi:ESPR domain-containing protein, partial [Escherichia coli]|nr:ESPR domain-containing protein [Escherichia coli]
MNKIYSLKYSHITGGLIAVSELSGRVSFRTSAKKKKNKLMLILCCLGILSPTYT